MADEKPRLLELEPRIVLLFAAISIPIIIVGALIILGFVRSEMNRTMGESLIGGAADDTARHLDSYLLDTLNNVSVVSASPILRESAIDSNRRYSLDPEIIRERLMEIDRLWIATNGAMQMAMDAVRNPASDYLREVVSIHETYREILVTDRQGALVAASNITSDYYQADEAWWREAFGDGERGAFYAGGVTYDQSANRNVLEIAVPLRIMHDEEQSEVVGVMKALIDAEELLSVIGSVKRGETGHALLVDATKGRIIVGPGQVMEGGMGGMVLLREAMNNNRRFFVGQQEDGEEWLASFAKLPQPTPAAYSNWLVVVRQRMDEANAPISAATLYLIGFVFFIVVMILLFSLYMHYKLVKPIREIDLREEMERLGSAES